MESTFSNALGASGYAASGVAREESAGYGDRAYATRTRRKEGRNGWKEGIIWRLEVV
jgi:hypothetical protein